MDTNKNDDYNKRPLWQRILIYGIVGLVVYGLIYYFVLAKKEETNNSPATSSATERSLVSVTLTEDGFSPKDLTIKANAQVVWTNKSGSDATVHSSPHPSHTDYLPLNLGNFADEGTLSLVFDKPGTYKYHNHLNPSQFGTIVVQ